MKQQTLIFSLLALLVFSFSCKKDEQPFQDCFTQPKDKGLKLTVLEGPTVEQPAKVSVFFKVQEDDNDPVGYLTQDDFIIYEKGVNDECYRVISDVEAKRRISGRAQVFNHTTLLVLDLSGSVLQTSLTELKNAATAFIDAIIPDTLDTSTAMGIYWFDGEDSLHVLEPVTSDKSLLKGAVVSISASISSDNSTDLFGAVIKSTNEATAVLASFQDQNIIAAASVVIFTDGRDRAGRYLRQDAYNAVATANSDISFFTIGVGSEINAVDLKAIGKNDYQLATSVSQLSTVFKNIALQVGAEANSYYFFEYCSPIRSGKENGLIIEAGYRSSTGDKVGFIQATFDASTFTGGCQL
ncbi:MAG: VWA domain-containing protein [Lewinellaceae bacterium]|nr:VWA domain-containing protein [Saprospiraceae bacterium]MCB9341032.1 VWA domain-containing protein [Lewinellaceae bacterium]